MADATTYQSLPITALPKRQPPTRGAWSAEAANALYAVISAPIPDGGSQPTATDGVAYTDLKAARAAANKAKRLVAHVLPDGYTVKTALFGLDKKGQPVSAHEGIGTFGFALWLIDATIVSETPATA